MSCQLAFMNTVSPLPAATSSSAPITTRRMPNLSISAAANGAVRPYSSRLTETAAEIVASGQPNSSCSGCNRTDGVARNPAAPTSATKATAATTQAGWSRRRDFTFEVSVTLDRADEWPESHDATDLAVDQVARQSGFGTAAALRQQLHQSIGVAPTTYRRTFRHQSPVP